MENTLENKEKFFAQYYGQTVQVDNDLEGKYPLTIGNISFDPEKCHLVLKPLSSITDEECIFISQIEKDYYTENDLIRGKVIIKNFINYINCSHSMKNSLQLINMIDYLRSIGYALPWMGLSVEKQSIYGWIKLV